MLSESESAPPKVENDEAGDSSAQMSTEAEGELTDPVSDSNAPVTMRTRWLTSGSAVTAAAEQSQSHDIRRSDVFLELDRRKAFLPFPFARPTPASTSTGEEAVDLLSPRSLLIAPQSEDRTDSFWGAGATSSTVFLVSFFEWKESMLS